VRIGAMIGDVIRSLFKKPATSLYPFEREATPARLRGMLHWNPEKCTGCCLCAKDCPSDALELIILDRKNKQFVLRYHADRCIYCAQCVQNCRFDCLEMSSEEWELAALDKKAFTVTYGDEADIATFLAKQADGDNNGPDAA
jgi:formate hydrogenlyase subunit 6/NADH:ubiquinone oxidoreductase subunit I